MRKRAAEGAVFYRNQLLAPEYVHKYFPPTQGEKNYERRPKVSFPVTGEIIDRIASMVFMGMSVTSGNDKIDALWQEIADRNEWHVFGRSMLTVPLSTGSQVVMLHNMNGVQFESWSGEFTYFMKSPFYQVAGYEYEIDKDGNLKPVLSTKTGKRPQTQVSVTADDTLFITAVGEEVAAAPHGLPFAPFVYVRGVDRDEVGRYAYPFSDRFDDLLIEYNLTFSQAVKAVRILQSVFVTNKTMDNPNEPLRLDPDTINFVGAEGKLEQVVRQLTLEPEGVILDRLKRHISTRAQVPDFMTGLQDVGKVESGIALAIVSGPLEELVGRIRYEFKDKVAELFSKSVQMESMQRGSGLPEFEVEVSLSETVIPQDAKQELDALVSANGAGLIAPEYQESLKARVASLLKLEKSEQAA